MTVNITPPDFVLLWSKYLCGNTDSLIKLSGGVNNVVYSCKSLDKSWVIKGYESQLSLETRDRMTSEIDFLRYSNTVAPQFTPKLYHVDLSRRCVVLEFVEGSSFSPHIFPPAHSLSDAITYFRLLNSYLGEASRFISQPAADGYLALTYH